MIAKIKENLQHIIILEMYQRYMRIFTIKDIFWKKRQTKSEKNMLTLSTGL